MRVVLLLMVLALPASSAIAGAVGGAADTDAPPVVDTTAATDTTAASSTTTAPGDDPTDGESWAAALAILGAIVLGAGVILVVSRAHDVQERLALATIVGGGTVTTSVAPAAGAATMSGQPISITGPDQVALGTAGSFTVDAAVQDPVWSVSGITAFTQRLKDAHTFLFTPHEPTTGVTVTVTDGTGSGEKPIEILPAPKATAFPLRFVVRSWGLVLVAVVVVFGAIALGLTGHLDGGNFVALVAPLAALLGVTAAGGGSQGGGGGNGGTGEGGGTPT